MDEKEYISCCILNYCLISLAKQETELTFYRKAKLRMKDVSSTNLEFGNEKHSCRATILFHNNHVMIGML